jgi:homoserine dehydrogenase
MNNTVKIGLIGFGNVGTGVAKLLLSDEKPFLRGRSFEVELVRIADLDITTSRDVEVPAGMLTTSVDDILDDPDIGIVVELIGGLEPARTMTLRAFAGGKSVVTANKALVAQHGDELFRAAKKAGVSYMFEAAVGGGIPIIRSIMDGLNANSIERVYGILNGTTNYILTGMTRDGLSYDDVLESAQELGFAEADPTSDVSGGDALNKLVILSRLAFGASLDVNDVFCEGIEGIELDDIQYAGELGYEVKLLAIAMRREDGRVEARVHPTLVPETSVLASVEDEFNAVEVYGDAVGREIFYGRGAGMMPTASAVVSDAVDIALRVLTGAPANTARIISGGDGPEGVPMEDVVTRYYLRFDVTDAPGVLADIASILADERISIESVIQVGTSKTNHVPLVIMTHEAREGAMQRAMGRFEDMNAVSGTVRLMRVESV